MISRNPSEIPDDERNYYLETRYPAFGNLVPRDVASRAAKEMCDDGYGVGASGLAVYLDFKDAIEKMGKETVSAKYGNLFAMYENNGRRSIFTAYENISRHSLYNGRHMGRL